MSKSLQRLDASSQCSSTELRFVQFFLTTKNRTKAYQLAMGRRCPDWGVDYVAATQMYNLPHVGAALREQQYLKETVENFNDQQLLARDIAVVRGYEQIDQLTRLERNCCRYCYGVNHKYQWRDEWEFLKALQDANTAQAANTRGKKRALARVLPSDEGGYGYTPGRDPLLTCPQCEGHGEERIVFADTRKLEGDLAAVYAGVEKTKDGLKYRTHDVDKALDRLYRARRLYGDTAVDVAKGAAAGAAAGAALAARTAEVSAPTTVDEAQRLYQDLIA